MAEQRKYTEQAYFKIDNVDDRSVPLLVNSCGEAVMKKNFITKRKRLDFYLMYILGGTMSAECAGVRFSLKRGQAICVSPNTEYLYMKISDSTEYVNYRWIHFTGSEAEKVISTCRIPLNTAIQVDIKEEVLSLFEELFYEFRNETGNTDTASSLILRYLLLKIGRSQKDETSWERKLDTSIHYIHTHIASPISVEELAAMEFLSPSRYRELFKKVTGHSPSEYVTLLRMRKACDLMEEGNISIEEIAVEVGYNDRLYFQRVFKKHLGITPGQYRKKD